MWRQRRQPSPPPNRSSFNRTRLSRQPRRRSNASDINDSTLKAPRDGRVQYRVSQVGEVLSAGGKVLKVNLGDVYMTFFLPTEWAGRAELGAEVRLVLDAAPQFVIPAKVTFVADVAQFTPKTVETAEERQKLTFRIKAHIPPGAAQEAQSAFLRSDRPSLLPGGRGGPDRHGLVWSRSRPLPKDDRDDGLSVGAGTHGELPARMLGILSRDIGTGITETLRQR